MHSSSYQPATHENKGFGKAITLLLIAGVIGLIAALAHVLLSDAGIKRFMFAYLVGFAFTLSLAIGNLFFVLINHLSNAGWSVLIRRVMEASALNVILLAVLFLPIAGTVALGNGLIYYWAQPDAKVLVHHYDPHGSHGGHGDDHGNSHGDHGDHADHAPASTQERTAVTASADQDEKQPPAHAELHTDTKDDHAHAEKGHGDDHAAHDDHDAHAGGHDIDKVIMGKRGYLNIPFFLIRWVIYFIVWGSIAWFFWSRSVKQDKTGDHTLTEKMHHFAGPCIFLYGLTLTLAAFDLMMSLEAHWFSTMFGVYYFAGSMLATFAFLILFIQVLQKTGRLTPSINTEHYHDLGKFLFGFVFFWSYIAFSQYMLYWYANMPETTFWYHMRGVSTQTNGSNAWTIVALLILFGHFALPFAGLLSRHVKRCRPLLLCWAVWLLFMHWVDMVWVVMPSLTQGKYLTIGLAEVGLTVMMVSIYLCGVLFVLSKNSLVPIKDPRIGESLAFQNM